MNPDLTEEEYVMSHVQSGIEHAITQLEKLPISMYDEIMPTIENLKYLYNMLYKITGDNKPYTLREDPIPW